MFVGLKVRKNYKMIFVIIFLITFIWSEAVKERQNFEGKH